MANEFFIPQTVVTGAGALKQCADRFRGFGQNALIVCGKSAVRNGTVRELRDMLQTVGIVSCVFDRIGGEPTDTMIREGLAFYRENGCDFLIGVGGGSPIDAMKAIAMMSVCSGTLSDYMGTEIVKTLPKMAAIPTTAGTGSEATQFAIITDTASGVKMLLKGRALMPTLAIVDAELSFSTPESVTVSSGLDALTHAIEAYISKKAQPLSDVLAVSAVKQIFENLLNAVSNGKDVTARGEMALAALKAGMAFNNSSVTLVHGMSRPIGALFHVPHGISNAMLLSVCLSFAESGARERFAALGRAIGAAGETDSDEIASRRFLDAVETLCGVCKVPTLARYGIDRNEFFARIPKMAEDAFASGSPSNTKKPVTVSDIEQLYVQLWK